MADTHYWTEVSESQNGGAETPHKHIRAKKRMSLGSKKTKIVWDETLVTRSTERVTWPKHH